MAQNITTATESARKQGSAATSTAAAPKNLGGVRFDRFFTRAGVSPYSEVQWERRDAVIQDFKGNIIF